MKTLAVMALFLLTLVPLQAQSTNLTGKWTGTMTRTAPDGQSQSVNLVFDLTQKGKELTGNVGPNPENVLAIEKGGTVDAGKITFKVTQPNGTKRTFTLKLVKDRLEGEMLAEPPGGAQSFTAKVDAGRAPKDK